MRIFLSILISFICMSSSFAKNDFVESCIINSSDVSLKSGWSDWEPYQFQQKTAYGTKLTGLDVEIQHAISRHLGVNIIIDEVDWGKHLEEVKEGVRDIAPGATFSAERSRYARFSDPYRFEENSLFISKNSDKVLNFNNINEMIAQIRATDFKLGVFSGLIYSDENLNKFIEDPNNRDIIIKNSTDTENLKALIRGDIDGFITDKLVGGALIINNKLSSYVREVPIDLITPISLMLSKRSTTPEILENINKAIADIKEDGTYSKISKEYLFPILLLQTINSSWFYVVTLIGVISFALSGVVIAAKENATLFRTFLYALIPNLIPGLIQEYIIDKDFNNFNYMSMYVITISLVVLFGFALIRLLEAFNKDANSDSLMQKFLENSSTYLDTLGMSSFIITGVTFALTSKLHPIEIWGPVCAFFIACTGCMIRDIFTIQKKITILQGDLNPEITVLWAFIFSLFLDYTADDPSQLLTSIFVVFVVSGALITRFITKHFKVSNLKYR